MAPWRALGERADVADRESEQDAPSAEERAVAVNAAELRDDQGEGRARSSAYVGALTAAKELVDLHFLQNW